jgi:hypothetical protein
MLGSNLGFIDSHPDALGTLVDIILTSGTFFISFLQKRESLPCYEKSKRKKGLGEVKNVGG